jgi:hypothetical protein
VRGFATPFFGVVSSFYTASAVLGPTVAAFDDIKLSECADM